MEKIIKKAYAKINLGLDVIRKLPNGYHEVKMIMQTVDIYDTLTISKLESNIELSVGEAKLPLDENNLIYKAARLIFERAKVNCGAKILLEKRIPIAAGMAGGSADAAATLVGLNELYQFGFSIVELKEMAVKLGADVPYCIEGGTALSEGIGEILTPIPAPPESIVLIAKPEIEVSTQYVYENLKLKEDMVHPDINKIQKSIVEGDLEGIADNLGNVLETVTIPRYPIIQEIKNTMLDCEAMAALMSGSGPTVFGLFREEVQAKEAKERLEVKNLVKNAIITGFK